MAARRILLISPDGPHRRGMARALSRDGHAVRPVAAEEAEGAFAEFGPDIVIELNAAAREGREPSLPSSRLTEAIQARAVRSLTCAPPVNMEELRQVVIRMNE